MSLKITFLDTETTGLGREAPAAIIQYCAAVWEDGDVTAIHSRLILPPEDVILEPKALEINGYDRQLWIDSGATPFSEYDADVLTSVLCGKAVVGGANVTFDKARVEEDFRRLGAPLPDWSHRDADISKMAYPLVVSGVIKSPSLQNVAAHYGHVVQNGLHTAESDVEAAIVCFEGLVDELVLVPMRWRKALEDIAAFSKETKPGLLARAALGL